MGEESEKVCDFNDECAETLVCGEFGSSCNDPCQPNPCPHTGIFSKKAKKCVAMNHNTYCLDEKKPINLPEAREITTETQCKQLRSPPKSSSETYKICNVLSSILSHFKNLKMSKYQ